MIDKKLLRKHISELKKRHTPEVLRQMSASLTNSLLANEKVRSAKAIMLYWSLPDEVYTHNMVRLLAKKGHTVLLPKVQADNELTLHRYTNDADLQRGAYGIMEPATPALTANECKQLLDSNSVSIIPGVAFSADGHRLGRGKGYYDRLLSRLTLTYKIGLCFNFQILEDIPYDSHDICMDMIWQTDANKMQC